MSKKQISESIPVIVLHPAYVAALLDCPMEEIGEELTPEQHAQIVAEFGRACWVDVEQRA